MTKIELKPCKYAPSIIDLRVNGRFVEIAHRITDIRLVSAGRWEGEAGGYPFEIIGGKASGGASNEWFVKWELNGERHYRVNSAAEAVRSIELA